MQGPEVVELMATWSAYWPDASLGPDRRVSLRAWQRLLADVEPAAGFAAVEAIAAEGDRFPPPVGLIRKRAVEIAGRASGDPVLDVDEAWALVVDRAARVGFPAGPDPGWPAGVADAVRALTWHRVCYDENPATLFAQFRDLYRPAAMRQAKEAVTTPAGRELAAGLAGTLQGRQRELDA